MPEQRFLVTKSFLFGFLLLLFSAFEANAQSVPPPWNKSFTVEEHMNQMPHGYPLCFVTNMHKRYPDIDCVGVRMCPAARVMTWGTRFVTINLNTNSFFQESTGDGVVEIACYSEPFPHHMCEPAIIAQANPEAKQKVYIRSVFAYRGTQVFRNSAGRAIGTFFYERHNVGDDDVLHPTLNNFQYKPWHPRPDLYTAHFTYMLGYNTHPICDGYTPSTAFGSRDSQFMFDSTTTTVSDPEKE